MFLAEVIKDCSRVILAVVIVMFKLKTLSELSLDRVML
jgi:hypothetical protein